MRGKDGAGCCVFGARWADWLAAASRRGRTSDVMRVGGACRLALAALKALFAVDAALLCQEALRRGRAGSCGSPMMARRARPRRERMASVEVGSLRRSSPVPRTAQRLTSAAMVMLATPTTGEG